MSHLPRLSLALQAFWPILGLAQLPAPSVPVTDTYHGVRVSDPYRNLEDLKNPQTRLWLHEQGEYAAAQLARIEGRDALRDRIAELAATTGDVVHSITRRAGGRVFYLKRAAGENQFKLIMREGLQGTERVLVDPQALARAKGVPHAINYFAPSWDGRTLAYGISAGGSEDASLYVMDVESGQQLREPIPRVQSVGMSAGIGGGVSWSPDSRWLAFNQQRKLPDGAPASETYFDSTVFVLDRRQPRAAPRAVFGRQVNPDLALDRLDVGQLVFAPDSAYMLARTTDTTVPEGRLFVAPVAALAGSKIVWRPVATAADQITDAQLRGKTLYLRTIKGAPRGRVIALDAADPRLERAVSVVTEPDRGVLEAFALGRRAVYVQLQEGFRVRVMRHDPAHPGAGEDVAPGLDASTFAIVERGANSDELWVATSTWTAPSRVYVVLADGSLRDSGLRDNRLPDGVAEIEATEVEVPSHDGVRVPMVVLHRKGMALDGRNPTLLNGYGAYGLTMQAGYDPRRFAWFERGGVLALLNPRGSGAYGDAWHRAGFKTSKPNTWKDGIAAARWLIDKGYASPATLGISGGSAGGIFVGRAVTSAPELFAAAIMAVPLLDTVRAEVSANGATNTAEFGTVKIETEFKALLEMSTYQHIVDRTPYPAILLLQGLNDPRVDVWHSAKATARFQQASNSGKPVLLRLDEQAGHGIGSTATQAAAQFADVYAFLLWQFGYAKLRP
jgi:prolyl oligopeptidase